MRLSTNRSSCECSYHSSATVPPCQSPATDCVSKYECIVADPEQGLSNYSSLVFTSLKLKLFHVHDIILISYKSQGVELSEKISSDQEIVTIY